MSDRIQISGLKISTIIGTLAWERQVPQTLEFDLQILTDFGQAEQTDDINDTIDYAQITEQLIDYIQRTQFRLLEALAEHTAQWLLKHHHIEQVNLTIAKPSALKQAKTVAIHITRPR